jgi:hypothetical protein
MEKVKLAIEVEPEWRRQVKLAATSSDQSVRQWIVNAIQRELDREGGDGLIMPARGAKPRGIANPPKPRSGRLLSDAVIEDRDASW